MSWPIRIGTCLSALALATSVLALVPLRDRPWAQDESYTGKVIENTLGMKLVRIEPGTFTMGSPQGEPGHSGQESQHEVVITKAFYMGKFEVTQEEYEKIMGKNPSAYSPNGEKKLAGIDTRRFPVESCTWQEARDFCKRLTKKELEAGRIKQGMEYTLPTEAEWEYCCRAGTQTAYATGPNLTQAQAQFSKDRTTTVGSFAPNAWGLHDMHGNVWEYCEDFFDANYYRRGPKNDPCNKKGNNCVLRGGGPDTDNSLCRSALRGSNTVDSRYYYNGFRVVLRLQAKSE